MVCFDMAVGGFFGRLCRLWIFWEAWLISIGWSGFDGVFWGAAGVDLIVFSGLWVRLDGVDLMVFWGMGS